jgi:hypothetical protein
VGKKRKSVFFRFGAATVLCDVDTANLLEVRLFML